MNFKFLYLFNLCIDTSLLIGSQQAYNNFSPNFNLSFCVFTRINKYNGDGGIIYFSGYSSNFSLFNSFFYLCSASGSGGAIYCNSNLIGSNFYGKNNCIYLCKSDLSYSFAYIEMYHNGKIHCNMTTNVLCIGWQTFSIRKSNIFFQNFNSSNNIAEYDCSYHIYYGSSSINSFLTCFNKSGTYVCISIDSTNNNISFYISFCICWKS